MLNDLSQPNTSIKVLLKKATIDIKIQEAAERVIRKEFDDAHMLSTQQACIDKAIELGYGELAEEMILDFNHEREVA